MILYFGNVKMVNGKLQGEAISLKMYEIYDVHMHHYIGFSRLHNIVTTFTFFWKHRKGTTLVHIASYSTLAFYYAFYVSILCKLFNKKYITVVHGGDFPNRLNKSKFLCSVFFNSAILVISPSNFLKYHLELHGFKSICIPNFIPIELFNFKERSNLQPKILWVRTFHEIYNTRMAARAIQHLVRKYPNIKLLMVGREEDQELALFKECVHELKLSDHIEIAGQLTRQEWVNRSTDYDIFISTTTIDNTPMSVIEAMALGLPVISTNVGGVPYIINSGEDGILVENNDDLAMAEAIDQLLMNPELVKKITKNGRLKAEKFSWEAVKVDWISALKYARGKAGEK